MLVEFGKFTGLRWNDTLSMETFVCEALRNYMKPAPAAQPQAAAPSESGNLAFVFCKPIRQRQPQRLESRVAAPSGQS